MTTRADTRRADDVEPVMTEPDKSTGKVILGNFPIGWGYAYRPKHPPRPRRKSRFRQLTLDFEGSTEP